MNELISDNNTTNISENMIDENSTNNEHEIKSTDKNNDSNNTKNILLYKNGDKYFPAKRFVVNKKYIRTWDSFLEELTKSIQPRSGAIRDIRTPFHGTRIRSLDDLIINGKYVAIPNGETMKLIDYATVVDVTSPISQSKKETRQLKPLKPINRVSEKTESKANPQNFTKGIVIYVYRNGDPFTRGIKIVLNQFEQKHMNVLVRAIEERVLLPSNRPIRRIYTMEGELIRFAKDIENGQYYVAASNEHFDNIKYGQYLPVVRAGKVQLKSSDDKIIHTQKPKTSRLQKKDTPRVEDPREAAAVKIQSAFRAYLTRNAIRQAQENNEPIPVTIHRHKPIDRKAPLTNIQSSNQTIKEEKTVRKDNRDNSTEIYNERKKPVENSNPDNNSNEHEIDSENEKKISSTKETTDEKETISDKSNVTDYDKQIAASKIQAGMRGYLFRKGNKAVQIHLEKDVEMNSLDNKDREIIPKNEDIEDKKEEINDQIETTDHIEENPQHDSQDHGRNIAASKIQACFRGFLTRKLIAEREENVKKERAAKVIQGGYRGYKARKGNKIIGDDIRRNKAASVIQASYRGFKKRLLVNEHVSAQILEKSITKQAIERNTAAAKIQASFRGHQWRIRQ